MKADFLADVRMHYVGLLLESGFAVPEQLDVSEVVRAYANHRRRLIEQKPRRVFSSSQLRLRHLHHRLRREVCRIKTRARVGKNLMPFLSKKMLDLNYNDPLLNEWGIHHLHFGGPPRRGQRFARRRNELLFARVTRGAIYLIDVLDHKSWTKLQLVEILHRNWPDSIADARPPGVVGAPPSSEQGTHCSAAHR